MIQGRSQINLFYTFKPFLSRKNGKLNSEISLNVLGNAVKDNTSIVEIFADHFAAIADGIGGIHVQQSPRMMILVVILASSEEQREMKPHQWPFSFSP